MSVGSVEEVAAAAGRRPLTATERNWLWALAIVVGSGLLFGAYRAIEESAGLREKEDRLVWNGWETSMRFLALSHFLVALVFTVSSRRMRTVKGLGWFAGLLAAGVLACVGFSRLGGMDGGTTTSAMLAVLFYGYFLVHEFRDQAFFYRANGDAPKGVDAREDTRSVLLVPALVFGLIAATFAFGAAFEIGGARRYDQAFDAFSHPVRGILGVLPMALVLAAAWAWRRRIVRTHPGGLRAFLARHRPILLVYLGIYAVLMLGIVATGRVYAIVTLHVTAWYVFTVHQLSRRPAPDPAPPPGSMAWMRGTVAGFNALHLGLAGVVVAAAAAWAYAFGNSHGQDALRVLLSRESFPYWTILHVTVSFAPKG
jgi:hypothetical protein